MSDILSVTEDCMNDEEQKTEWKSPSFSTSDPTRTINPVVSKVMQTDFKVMQKDFSVKHKCFLMSEIASLAVY